MANARLAVLVSGSGTILEAILAEGIEVELVVADRRCRGLDVAADAGITAVLIDRLEFGGFTKEFDRERFTTALIDSLQGIDLIAMAGFGTIASASFFDTFAHRVLNTHPSLLPAFPGWHAVRDALAAGVAETGCTVHFATATVDDGPIVAQQVVAVNADDDESTLHERIKHVERELYPRVIREQLALLHR